MSEADFGATGGAGGDGGDGGAGGGTTAPEWLGGLPDELKGDATLSRYKSVEDLARGHIEAHKVAKSKFSVPAADAPPEAWGQVFDALGRPADAAAYEIPLPEGVESSPIVDAFKPVAHKIGLLPQQAKELGAFWNEQMAATEQAYYDKGAAEVEALKLELGGQYDAKLEAAKKAAAQLGFGPEVADELDRKVGSANLLKAFMGVAEKIGELRRVDPDNPDPLNPGAPQDAAAVLKEKQKDPTWRERLKNNDPIVKAEYERLLGAAKNQAVPA